MPPCRQSLKALILVVMRAMDLTRAGVARQDESALLGTAGKDQAAGRGRGPLQVGPRDMNRLNLLDAALPVLVEVVVVVHDPVGVFQRDPAGGQDHGTGGQVRARGGVDLRGG